MKINKKGFTLVELLVVIAIIAILSVIGLTLFSGVQSNARDARRKSDIDAIANAIETTRTPGTAYYTSLPKGSFSAGTVPVDNGAAAALPQYCIRTTTATSVPTDIVFANWGAAVQCPSSPAAQTPAGESTWTAIPSDGIVAQATSANNPFYTSTISWKVCSKLESGTVYCKPSSQ